MPQGKFLFGREVTEKVPEPLPYALDVLSACGAGVPHGLHSGDRGCATAGAGTASSQLLSAAGRAAEAWEAAALYSGSWRYPGG